MTCYKTHIGRPYINGGGCQSIQDKIRNEVKYIANYHCDDDDGAGQTSLSFSTAADPAANIGAIEALQKSYPMVPFEAERICLLEGNAVPEDWPSPDGPLIEPVVVEPVDDKDDPSPIASEAEFGAACRALEAEMGMAVGCDEPLTASPKPSTA